MIRYLRQTDKIKLRGTALLRLDFNTEDEWRMQAAIPTIKFLLRYADKVVILSHRGRPVGRDLKFSLRKDAKNLSRMLRQPVHFIPHFDFEKIKQEVARTPRRTVFIMENLRFLLGEEKNDARLAKELAAMGNYYVNDAFAVSHRADASVAAITKFLPSYAGLELEKEIAFLSRVIKKPKRPLVVVIGGGKVHDKLGILRQFRKKADCFLLGGVAANTMLFLRGDDVGLSMIDADAKDQKFFKSFLKFRNVILPVDGVKPRGVILDIGPKTVRIYAEKIKSARTVIWGGPLGYIENPRFGKGTLAVARAITKNKKAFSVAGGGETVMFFKKHKLDKKFSFVSTGGGAMLEYLAGEKLPGIEALK